MCFSALRIRVWYKMVTGKEMKIKAMKTNKEIYKRRNLTPYNIYNPVLYVERGAAGCDCPLLTSLSKLFHCRSIYCSTDIYFF